MIWLLALIGCGGGEPATTGMPVGFANVAPAVVREALSCDGRPILRVEEAEWDFYVRADALSAAAAVGDHVWIGRGRVERDVSCGSRRLPEVIGVDRVVIATPAELAAFVKLDPPAGGVSIADLHARRLDLKGQDVAVRGRVTRVSSNVFGKNWVHLADGTGEGATADLTVNTDQALNPGDVVVVRGPVTVDLDLGFGYFYPVILEKTEITVESGGSS